VAVASDPLAARAPEIARMNVKTLCLGVLQLGSASGYEIRKLTQDGPFSHFVDASYGAIYPALSALEAERLVSCREERRPGRPDRRVYSITPLGHEALLAALAESPRQDVIKSEFLFVLRLAELAAPAHISNEIDRRLARLEDQIAQMEEALERKCEPTGRFVCGYGLAVYRAMHGYLAENRRMVEAVAGIGLAARDAAE
jgi:DNA-binding PadR family transcriptional regulator